tara:strand:- start:296 stop:454 length:159 start_codon:yes stop_codon:yes gene_type:complete
MAYAEKIENLGESDWYLIDRKPIDVHLVIQEILGKLFSSIQAKKTSLMIRFI